MGRSHADTHTLESRWGTQSCAICGATIVLGEPTVRLLVRGRRQVLCTACAAEPAVEWNLKCRLDDLSRAS
jgi:hypothetical protein